jgi:UDP-2-acetamido-3-amino-2,3-dideoxy-glucuronate N-acetyltransferase
VTIGAYAFVGAGSVVVKDIPDYALVVGNPGRIIGWMCVCGERIRFSEEEENAPGNCQACQRQYLKKGMEVVPHD